MDNLLDCYSLSWGGRHFEQRKPDVGNLHLLHIGANSFKFTVSIPHVRNMGSTWGQLWPTRPQLLRPNLGPTCHNLAPSWTRLGVISAQAELHNEIVKKMFSLVSVFPVFWHRWRFVLSHFLHGGSPLGEISCKAVARGSPAGPCASHASQLGSKLGTPALARPKASLRTQRDTLKTCVLIAISNVFSLWWGLAWGCVPHIGPVLGPTSAPHAPTQDQVAHVKPNLRQNVPKLRHVGPQLGSLANWPEFGAS